MQLMSVALSIIRIGVFVGGTSSICILLTTSWCCSSEAVIALSFMSPGGKGTNIPEGGTSNGSWMGSCVVVLDLNVIARIDLSLLRLLFLFFLYGPTPL